MEYNETFSVELSTVDSHVALGGQTTAIVTILDDDCTFAFSNST